MLSSSPLTVFVPSLDLGRARTFYEGVLGLRFLQQDAYALVFELEGVILRVVRVEQLVPAPFTILGWRVPDIAGTIGELAMRGVSSVRYEQLEQDGLGVWSAPGGTRVAWFRDPDGNLLSLSEG